MEPWFILFLVVLPVVSILYRNYAQEAVAMLKED
jgi:hypothetical protein